MFPSLLPSEENKGNRAKLIDESLRNYFSTFPQESKIIKLLKNAFVINVPMLGVGGDGYWLHDSDGKIFLVVFDCMGHGRVASIMTRLYVNVIKHTVVEEGLIDPGKILESIHLKVRDEFENKENLMIGSGADMIVLRFDRKQEEILFASAKMDFIKVQNDSLERIKPNKKEYQVGEHFDIEHTYTTRTLPWPADQLQALYFYTDGITDLIGGVKEKKLGSKKFETMILEVQDTPFDQQKPMLLQKLKQWQGQNEAFDDMLLLGLLI